MATNQKEIREKDCYEIEEVVYPIWARILFLPFVLLWFGHLFLFYKAELSANAGGKKWILR